MWLASLLFVDFLLNGNIVSQLCTNFYSCELFSCNWYKLLLMCIVFSQKKVSVLQMNFGIKPNSSPGHNFISQFFVVLNILICFIWEREVGFGVISISVLLVSLNYYHS